MWLLAPFAERKKFKPYKTMTKLLKFFLCFCASLLMAGGLQAEEVTEDVSANLGAIRGRIVDEAKHTLPGASIWISGFCAQGGLGGGGGWKDHFFGYRAA